MKRPQDQQSPRVEVQGTDWSCAHLVTSGFLRRLAVGRSRVAHAHGIDKSKLTAPDGNATTAHEPWRWASWRECADGNCDPIRRFLQVRATQHSGAELAYSILARRLGGPSLSVAPRSRRWSRSSEHMPVVNSHHAAPQRTSAASDKRLSRQSVRLLGLPEPRSLTHPCDHTPRDRMRCRPSQREERTTSDPLHRSDSIRLFGALTYETPHMIVAVSTVDGIAAKKLVLCGRPTTALQSVTTSLPSHQPPQE